jgi:hypothetical protein
MKILLLFFIAVLSYSYLRQYNLPTNLEEEGFTIDDAVEFDIYENQYNK